MEKDEIQKNCTRPSLGGENLRKFLVNTSQKRDGRERRHPPFIREMSGGGKYDWD